ncbi:hypothetical protein [Candidatus Phytoplasma fabacearum]|uniref:hypothetical protein n=1 Tax=Candidatus Phytoplasma fabacearum TaxID=2982628 RepID=UPI002712E48D|nr:hypothetical protein ['Bituminaria bituminosa' little leaf phytoplasma]MDV3148829.1 hypothetical protein [Pigeon pea little leaf phytoplasma]MDO7983800.1 hypothetical protein ['Bituminaria bituminosa' little leaf phytoplasma]MDO8030745.1 hypothetical protein ['Bituminaria bituminosa' little leaf phytoplasma]MDV3154271.1 hypothetical protein [Pigeon pea little leaf phytoplasma]MDV3163568.1 hypothetical protein [Pigeon pea little leaf phytoplasma]
MDIFIDGRNKIIVYYEHKKQKIEQLFKKQDLLEKEAKEKKLPNYLNNKIIDSSFISDNTKLDNLSKKNIKNNDKLMKINQKIFSNYFRSRLESFNFLYYIKKYYPFKKYDTDKNTILNNFKSYCFNKKNNSKLYLYLKIIKQKNEKTQYFLIKYKCNYLEEDFVDNTNLKLINFRFNLNIVLKNLYIYKGKINNNKNKAKKTENNKKTSSDW